MTARIRKLLSDLGETFWLIPALMVLVGVLLAVGLVRLDRGGLIPQWLLEGSWLYSGGATGARTSYAGDWVTRSIRRRGEPAF